MLPRFQYGEQVRVVRTVRDDGTFPGRSPGDVLVREGSVGHVRNVGTYLQEQIIYAVHFVPGDIIVGCREEELIAADEPWVPTQFLSRDKVTAAVSLAVGGSVVVPPGASGEIMQVFRHAPNGPAYQVNFDGRFFVVPESALQLREEPADVALADN